MIRFLTKKTPSISFTQWQIARKIIGVFVILCLATSSWAQLRRPKPDSLQRLMRRGMAVSDSLLTKRTIPDTSTAVKPKAKYDYSKHLPRKAALRSLMLPGWGQIYNRQYLRLPFIYGGLFVAAVGFRQSGVTAGYYWNHQVYKNYLAAYKFSYLGDDNNLGIVRDLNLKHYPIGATLGKRTIYTGQFVPEGQVEGIYDSEGKPRLLTIDQITRGKDYYRRNRDISVLFFLSVWVFNAIEANVSAHLLTFPSKEQMEDLSLKVEPYMESNGVVGNIVGSKVVLKF